MSDFAFLMLLVLISIVALTLDSRSEKQRRLRVQEKYADLIPVSDEAFVAACSPRVNPEVALKVRDIIVDQFGIPAERIHPNMTLLDLEYL